MGCLALLVAPSLALPCLSGDCCVWQSPTAQLLAVYLPRGCWTRVSPTPDCKHGTNLQVICPVAHEAVCAVRLLRNSQTSRATLSTSPSFGAENNPPPSPQQLEITQPPRAGSRSRNTSPPHSPSPSDARGCYHPEVFELNNSCVYFSGVFSQFFFFFWWFSPQDIRSKLYLEVLQYLMVFSQQTSGRHRREHVHFLFWHSVQ